MPTPMSSCRSGSYSNQSSRNAVSRTMPSTGISSNSTKKPNSVTPEMTPQPDVVLNEALLRAPAMMKMKKNAAVPD